MEIENLVNSSTQINVLKRTLHVLALTQKEEAGINWNSTTLTDIISAEEKATLDTRVASTAIKNTKALFNVGLDIKKGGRNISGSHLEPELEKELILFYSGFVASDSARGKAAELLLKKHQGESLWLLARLYFASVQRKKIIIEYTPLNSESQKSYKLHPYHLTVNKNSFYLISFREKDGKIGVYPLHRVDSIKVLDELYSEEPPVLEKIYNYSFGPFIGDDPLNITIEYSKEISRQLEENFNHLNLVVSILDDGTRRASFVASDIEEICRELFYYGNKVIIRYPSKAKEIMSGLLRETLARYE